VLLDTHALLWWLAGDRRLSSPARETIAQGAYDVYVSAASAWEISTKVRLGKLPEAGFLTAELASILRQQGFQTLPITLEHALLAGSLPGPHKDPFDRMLIAQSRIEGLPVVTRDPVFVPYGVETVW